jgi:hypothetical protein
MAISYADALRTNRMDEVVDLAGALPIIRIYAGARPDNEGAEGTLLSTLVCDDPIGATTAGVLEFGAIADDTSATAGGVAAWFRIYTAGAAAIILDGSVGTAGSGADLILDSTTITAGQTVSIDTFIITEGNDYAA